MLILQQETKSQLEIKTAVVRIEYDKNVSSDQLPTTGETLALTFSMNFVQA